MVVAIDPGKDGGIVVFDKSKIVGMYNIPRIKTKIDYNELSTLLKGLLSKKDMFVVIEEVHAIFGSSAAASFSFGHTNGFLLGLIVGSNCPYTMIQPKEWQSGIWINQDKVYKESQKRKLVDTKATSLMAAKRLVPG